MSLLSVESLTVRYPNADSAAVNGLTLSMEKGESVGLVGESGSGKTQAALAIMGLIDRTGQVSGSIRFCGEELRGASPKTLRKFRARRIAMVFQDPQSALNPYRRIGDQLGLVLAQHGLASGSTLRRRVLEMLEKTGLPDPERQARAYPHELSGGMRQRAMIASALLAEPELLIADEPTTALDATVQAQILALLRDLRAQTGVALLLITHDLGIIAGHCERLLVLDKGSVIEHGSTERVFAAPERTRTRAMLEAVRNPKRLAPEMENPSPEALLEVAELSVGFSVPRPGRFWGRRELVAVQPTSLRLRPGETLALVGESGSGKTSFARAVLGLLPPGGGTVSYLGKVLAARLKDRRNTDRRQLQLVFQHPRGSLDPAMRVFGSIEEPLRVHRPALAADERADCVRQVLARVGLAEALLDRFPHQLSGGQAQRVAIARSLIVKPRVLVCDEALASLDGTVRQDILELLADEQRRSGLSIVFISHDLNVVRQISHRVLVMYMGRSFELADSADLFTRPRHPYTRALVDSMPCADPGREVAAPPVVGETSSVLDPPGGCVFHPRCRYAEAACREEAPRMRRNGRAEVACLRADELNLTIERPRQRRTGER